MDISCLSNSVEGVHSPCLFVMRLATTNYKMKYLYVRRTHSIPLSDAIGAFGRGGFAS